MVGGVEGNPLGPAAPETIAGESPFLAGFQSSPSSIRLLHPALKGTLLGDGHLALNLQQLAGGEFGVERADQFQAFEEHLHSAILDLLVRRIQQSPLQLGVKAAAVLLDLILIQLAWLPKPAIGVAVEASPVEKRIDVNGLASKLDAVLLKTSLQLLVLLLGSGHILEAGDQGYRCQQRPTSPPGRLIGTRASKQHALSAEQATPIERIKALVC